MRCRARTRRSARAARGRLSHEDACLLLRRAESGAAFSRAEVGDARAILARPDLFAEKRVLLLHFCATDARPLALKEEMSAIRDALDAHADADLSVCWKFVILEEARVTLDRLRAVLSPGAEFDAILFAGHGSSEPGRTVAVAPDDSVASGLQQRLLDDEGLAVLLAAYRATKGCEMITSVQTI